MARGDAMQAGRRRRSAVFALLLALAPAGAIPAAAEAGASSRVFDVRSFGAAGDGIAKETQPLQRAIDACHATGGGVVELPAGRYLTGTLRMRSRVTLRVQEGATLLGSSSLADYAADVQGAVEAPAFNKCLIYAEDAQGIGFEGKGTVDGCGSRAAFPERVNGRLGERPMIMRLVRCGQAAFSGLTFRNPASWGLHLVQCRDVRFEGITVQSKNNHINNDGIDLDGCADVTIANCRITSGDDAVCLKSTFPEPCRNIVVQSCFLSSDTAGFKLGTSSRGGFVGVRLADSHFHECPMGAVKLLLGDGGRLEDVELARLTMEGVGGPIFIRLGNRGRLYNRPTEQVYGGDVRPEGAAVGTLRKVRIRDVTARVSGGDLARQGVMITGIPGHRIEDLTLENIRIRYPGGGNSEFAARQVAEDIARYPEQHFFGVLPSWGLFLRHACGVVLRNVQLDCELPDARPPVCFEDVSRLEVSGLLAGGVPVSIGERMPPLAP